MTNPTPSTGTSTSPAEDAAKQSEQDKFDSEVKDDASQLDALERHYADLEAVVSGLKAQPAAQAMNFTALDVFSMRLKADSLGQLVPPTAPGELPAVPAAPADSRPGDVGIAAIPPTPQPAPTNVPATQPASTMVAPGQANITDQPASTMIPPIDGTPVSVSPVGTPAPATPAAPVQTASATAPSMTPPPADAAGPATATEDKATAADGKVATDAAASTDTSSSSASK